MSPSEEPVSSAALFDASASDPLGDDAIIIALGVVAALDQLHIAAAVVNAVLYAVLAAVTGVIIVAVGGGGIKTMSTRWELLASRYDQEKVQVQQQLRSAPSVTEQARTLRPAAPADGNAPFTS